VITEARQGSGGGGALLRGSGASGRTCRARVCFPCTHEAGWLTTRAAAAAAVTRLLLVSWSVDGSHC
jgi:hypothetical protein